MDGYIKIHRKIIEWEWYSDPNTKIIFLHLLLNANFRPVKYCGVELKAGELIVTLPELAGTLQLTVQNVRTALNHLKSTGEITVRTTNRFSVVTIEKWEMYQVEDYSANRQANRQANSQLTGNQQTTNRPKKKNDKNDKNINNNIYIMPALGEFGNVHLTEEELEKLKERFPYDWQAKIERLSEYMASRGKRYKSHYATILSWARKDEKNAETGSNIGHESTSRTGEKDYSADGSGFKT